MSGDHLDYNIEFKPICDLYLDKKNSIESSLKLSLNDCNNSNLFVGNLNEWKDNII